MKHRVPFLPAWRAWWLRGVLRSSAAFALLLGSASVARAAPVRVASDEVVVDDGSVWRGEIVDFEEGDHVTVRRSTGEQGRIRWDAVVRVVREGTAIPLPGPRVHVHVEASPPVVLERRHAFEGRWEVVCTAPCDRELPSGVEYRVRGATIRSSGGFLLRGLPGERVWLHLDRASPGAFGGGAALTVLGSAVILTGFVAGATSGQWADNLVYGSVGLAAGLPAMIAGIIVMSSNNSTRVKVSAPPPSTKPVAPEGVPSSFTVTLVVVRF